MPLPDRDFDVTEVAVPWKLLTEAGYRVIFATEDGATPAADPLLISGVVFGKLGARPDAIAYYRELEQDPAFRSPRCWRELDPAAFAGLFLPGGHAQGMIQYLGSEELHRWIATFWRTERPVAAICHGVLALARATDESGRSVLHGHRTTCLPKYMERSAYLLTFWKLGRYYRTYFERGPRTLVKRGTRSDHRAAFVVEDRRYVSGRWPGDSYLVAQKFIALLQGTHV
jgi:putative intracellular protease/amidase